MLNNVYYVNFNECLSRCHIKKRANVPLKNLANTYI